MIAIYANWTGSLLVGGATLDEARARLICLDCDRDTVFGAGRVDVTALDIGMHDFYDPAIAELYRARRLFPVVSATGPARIPAHVEG